jgi:hypothetical protein
VNTIAPTPCAPTPSAPVFPLWRTLHERQPKLAAFGLLFVLAAIPLVVAGLIDPRTVNGVSVWVKPVKFLLSIAVYLWTLAWFTGHLGPQSRQSLAGRYVVHGTVLFTTLELAWIIGMSVAGQPSHFNRASAAAGVLYSLAGLGAVGLTVSMLIQGVQLARDRTVALAPAFRLSLVLGSLLGGVGTLVFAGFMASGKGHWIGGIASDAAGLPLIGWSRTGGDLRVAHFWATHAQQFVPLAGAVLAPVAGRWAMPATALAALAYVAFAVFTFAQALAGRPFLPG